MTVCVQDAIDAVIGPFAAEVASPHLTVLRMIVSIEVRGGAVW